MNFLATSHLSEILESSKRQKVIVFKYSNSCASSERLKNIFEEYSSNNKILDPVYLVTVQTQRILSNKIEEYFDIKHESPQVLIIENEEVIFSANHNKIYVKDLLSTIL